MFARPQFSFEANHAAVHDLGWRSNTSLIILPMCGFSGMIRKSVENLAVAYLSFRGFSHCLCRKTSNQEAHADMQDSSRSSVHADSGCHYVHTHGHLQLPFPCRHEILREFLKDKQRALCKRHYISNKTHPAHRIFPAAQAMLQSYDFFCFIKN